MDKQYRAWCFTQFSIDQYEKRQDPLPVWKGLKYRVYSLEECPSTKRLHFQGYAYFKSAKTFGQVTKLLPGANIRAANGNSWQNEVYCSKDHSHVDGPWIYGERPLTDKEKGETEKARWSQMRDLAIAGEFGTLLQEYPKEYLLHESKFRRLYFQMVPIETLDVLEHEWWYGPTGTGKSSTARSENPGAYIKDPKERWWDNYNKEEVVIIDDFDKFQVSMGGDMKRWLDHYPFQAPMKGSYAMIRPRKIIVTSNYSPEEIWQDEQTLAPIMRRVTLRSF